MEDPNFFFYAKLLLKFNGFSLNENNFLLKFWSTLCIFLHEIAKLSLIYNGYDKYPDIVIMITCSTVAIGFTVNTFKIITIYLKIGRMGDFYRRLIEYWKIPEKDEKAILMEHKPFTNIVSLVNFISLMAGISWWVFLPPAMSLYEKYTVGNATWQTAYNITYIDFIKYTPAYEISMLVYYMLTVSTIIGGCAFDSYFLESCFYLAGHFKIIYQRYQRIKFSLERKEDGEVLRQLSSVIEYHNEILNACTIFEDLIRSAILPFILFDCFVVCFCLYTLLSMPNWIITTAFTGISCAAIAQIFILTFSGEVVTTRSQDLIEGIYDSEWYAASPSQRKYLILCMMRARKGFIFQMGLFQLTLPTLTTILQSAGSYIALLKTLSD